MARPKLPKRKPTRSVTLKEESIQLLAALGDGNVSAGVEKALQGYIAFRALSGLEPLRPIEHNPPQGPKRKGSKKPK